MKNPMSRFQSHDDLTAPEGSATVLRGALASGGQLPNFLGVLAGSPARALTTDHRLERTVLPTSEALALDIDPSQQGYHGTATIGLRVTAAVDSFQLHARNLTIDKLTVANPGHLSLPG